MDLPAELVEQINASNTVLILGHNAALAQPGELNTPTYDQLAQALAKESNYEDHNHTLPRVAQHYEWNFGREALVKFVGERLQSVPSDPLRVHRILARLPFRLVVTTCLDNRLEQALLESERPFVKVIRNADIAYEDEDKLLLVKLYGDLALPDSLVLTEENQRHFLEEVVTISDILNRLIASRTLFLIGNELDDGNFIALYNRITRSLDRHSRYSYAIYQNASAYAVNSWQKLNDVHVHQAQPAEILHQLEQLLQKQREVIAQAVASQARPTDTIPQRPYKFLNSFQEADEAIFFGRDREKSKLLSKIVSYRLVLLFGKSGVGKTSLLQASLIPALSGLGYYPVYARVLTDPQAEIIRAAALAKSGLALPKPDDRPALTSQRLSDELTAQIDRTRLRQVLSDRFSEEELRTLSFELGVDYEALPAAGKDNKARELVIFLERRGRISESIVVGRRLRPDFAWDDITVLTGEPSSLLPEPKLGQPSTLYSYLIQVDKVIDRPVILLIDQFEEFFTQLDAQTRAAFIRELGKIYADDRLKVKIVLSFREDFLAELNSFTSAIPTIFNNQFRLERLTLEQAREAIFKPASRCGIAYEEGLIERLLADLGGGKIDPPQLQIVCDTLYEALDTSEEVITNHHYEQLGKASAILANYLDRVLKQYSNEQQSIIQSLLKAFITSSDTKAVLTVDGLAQRARLPAERVRQLLNELLRARLIRRAESETQYELAHEYLVSRIASWMDTSDREHQRAREVLELGLAKWKRYRLHLYRDELQLIYARLDALELDEEAIKLLVNSAVLSGIDPVGWLERTTPKLRQTILQEAIDSDIAEYRRQAVRLIGHFAAVDFQEQLANLMLTDPVPTVRQAAALSLARLDETIFVNNVTAAARLKDTPEREAALEAIAAVQDAGPSVLDTEHLSLKLRWRLGQLRLRRNRAERNIIIVSAALGGTSAAAMGGLVGVTLSPNIDPEKWPVATLFAAFIGLILACGIAFGLGTAEAMGERRLSLFYVTVILPSLLVTGVIFGLLDTDLQRGLLAAAMGLSGSLLTGVSLAIIVNLTRDVKPSAFRLAVRVILNLLIGLFLGLIFGWGVANGAVSTRNEQGQIVPLGFSYGFGIGFLVPAAIAASIEIAQVRYLLGIQHDEPRGLDVAQKYSAEVQNLRQIDKGKVGYGQ